MNQTLPVGAPLMVIGDKDEQVPTSFVEALTGGVGLAAGATNTPAAQMQTSAAAPVAAEPEPSKPAGKIMVSPRAKKMAEELGVDLATVKGTGPAGKITEADIRNAAEAKAAQAPAAKPAPAAVPLWRLGPPRPLPWPRPSSEARSSSIASSGSPPSGCSSPSRKSPASI